MDCSLPGSSIHGIFQARVQEWGAIAFADNPMSMSLNSEIRVRGEGEVGNFVVRQRNKGKILKARNREDTLLASPGQTHGGIWIPRNGGKEAGR